MMDDNEMVVMDVLALNGGWMSTSNIVAAADLPLLDVVRILLKLTQDGTIVYRSTSEYKINLEPGETSGVRWARKAREYHGK